MKNTLLLILITSTLLYSVISGLQALKLAITALGS